MSHEFITTKQTIIHDTSTTQYSAKDVISAGTTVPMAFNCNLNGGKVVKLLVKTNVATFIGKVRVFFFTDPTTSLAADNAVLAMLYTQSYIGYIETELESWGANSSIGGTIDELAFGKLSSNILYGVLVANSTPTPANGMIFTVEVTTENY